MFFQRKHVLNIPKIRGQLSFRQLITEQTDVQEIYAKSCVDSPPVSNFDATNADCVTIENVGKTAFFGTFSAATQVIMVGLKIGEREVKLRIILRLSYVLGVRHMSGPIAHGYQSRRGPDLCLTPSTLHYFAVTSIAKYLIAVEVRKNLMGCGNFLPRETAEPPRLGP